MSLKTWISSKELKGSAQLGKVMSLYRYTVKSKQALFWLNKVFILHFVPLLHKTVYVCLVFFFFLSFSATKPGKQMHLRPLEVLISIRYYGVAILPSNHQHWFKMMHFDSIALISKIFRFTKIKSYFMMLPCSSYRQAKTTHF